MNIRIIPYKLIFHKPAGTSRGILTAKESWYFILSQKEKPDIYGIGECSLLPGLSPELHHNIYEIFRRLESDPEAWLENTSLTSSFPAIRFALETAYLDWQNEGKRILFPGPFTNGQKAIPINGLIWMGKPDEMIKQIHEKVEAGFTTLKMKVGAIDFEKELEIIRYIRSAFSSRQLTLRLDANGAFNPCEALDKLKQLSAFDIHSIEQPIKANQPTSMALLCEKSPIPVALDEELIGIHSKGEKEHLLDTIRPAYIILKPSLHGGISGAEEWIRLATQRNIGWWITSALESNIGLNAIAQWTGHIQAEGVQGLGTGTLYKNNIPSPLYIHKGMLRFDPNRSWTFNFKEL
ncbi:MAG: o-succinylbenzoate synthase [Bacteroidales bacterium]|nr:o-succinylbenzoate synthase [Bacteroidales bacterium]NPV35431.1 o-succinylbenzoate synthase [Bacteroidales bacterium]